MKIAPPHILEKIIPILVKPYRRRIRWRGNRLAKEMENRGWYKCRGVEGYKKRFGRESVHIKCYPDGCYYHIDTH